tara:strand:+ start:834 stop:1004 length:171 start_codon:yes stop_codon:yes gene_type:complete
MNQTQIKDTAEFIAVNATGIGISLTSINEAIRTLILVGTLIYTFLKIYEILNKRKK